MRSAMAPCSDIALGRRGAGGSAGSPGRWVGDCNRLQPGAGDLPPDKGSAHHQRVVEGRPPRHPHAHAQQATPRAEWESAVAYRNGILRSACATSGSTDMNGCTNDKNRKPPAIFPRSLFQATPSVRTPRAPRNHPATSSRTARTKPRPPLYCQVSVGGTLSVLGAVPPSLLDRQSAFGTCTGAVGIPQCLLQSVAVRMRERETRLLLVSTVVYGSTSRRSRSTGGRSGGRVARRNFLNEDGLIAAFRLLVFVN